MYKGNEPCQGCGNTGAQKPRWKKNQLCSDCEAELKTGRSKHIEDATLEYVHCNVYWYWERNNEASEFFSGAMRLLNNPFADAKFPEEIMAKEITGLRGGLDRYKVPKKLFGSLKQAALKLDAILTEAKQREDKALSDAKALIESELSNAYNAGIERGRNLLVNLLEDDLSMGEISAKAESYNFKSRAVKPTSAD
jgi:hypothetical protein